MPLFDQNRWYQINSGNFGTGLSLVGTPVFNKDGTGTTFMRTTNTSDIEQRWQIFPAENGTYILRTQGSGENVYLHANEFPTEDTLGRTAAGTINAKFAGEEVFWRIQPYDNGQFYLENVANGSAWHLFVKGSAFLAMTSNIAGKQQNQVFNFTQKGEINNSRFSTFKAPALLATATDISRSSSATSTPTSQTTGSPLPASTSNTTTSSNSLSSGAKIGIAVGVAAIALIAIIFGVLIFLRRRKSRKRSLAPGPSDVKEPQVYYQHIGGDNDAAIHEAGGNSAPAELYGNTVHADVELPAEPVPRK
jgi:hypothetical protein